MQPPRRRSRRIVSEPRHEAPLRYARLSGPILVCRAEDGDARVLAASETRRELGAHLAELPPAQAQVAALEDAFDLPFEELAAVTGPPVGAAKRYAHRGRNELRARLAA